MFAGFTSRWTSPAAWAASRPPGDLVHEVHGLVEAEPPAVGEDLRQAGAVDEPHHEKQAAVLLPGAVHGDHVRVLDRGGLARLPAKALPELVVGRALGRQDLQRPHAVELGVARAVDHAHPAAPDLALDLQAGERGAGLQAGSRLAWPPGLGWAPACVAHPDVSLDPRGATIRFVQRRSPTENATPRELQRQLAAEREGHPFLAYRDEQDELVLEPLPGSDTVTIGRGEGTHVRIGWDPQISQLHAELRPLGGEWLVVDDGLSRNGTFVDGERVAGRRRLRDRDLLRVGTTLILFRYPGAEATRGETAMASESAPDLTPAQRKVLDRVCAVRSPKVRGSPPRRPTRRSPTRLVLSVEAVKAHLRGLFERFEVGDVPQNQKRVALAERAFRTGSVTPRDLRG